MRRIGWILLAVLIIGGAVYAWAATTRSSTESRQVVAQERLLMPVERSTISRTLTYSGLLEPIDDVTLTAGISSWVKELYVSKGDVVRAGDVIARLDDTEVQVEVMRARRDYDQARLESPPGVVEERRLALMTAERKLSATTIVAPFDGIVADVMVREGANVSANGSIARLVNPTRYKVTLAVDQKDLANIAVGQEVFVTPTAVPGLTLLGRVQEIDFLPASADSTTTYAVTVVLDETMPSGRAGGGAGGFGGAFGAPGGRAPAGSAPSGGPGTAGRGGFAAGGPAAGAPVEGAMADGPSGPASGGPGATADDGPGGLASVNLAEQLRPGMSVDAEIVVAVARDVIVVPIAAIVESGRQQLVTRVTPDGVEEVVAVETGITDGMYVEIRSGLEDGDRIVINNYMLFQSLSSGGGRGQGGGGQFIGGFGIPAGPQRVIFGR